MVKLLTTDHVLATKLLQTLVQIPRMVLNKSGELTIALANNSIQRIHLTKNITTGVWSSRQLYNAILDMSEITKLSPDALIGFTTLPWEIRLTENFHGIISSDGVDVLDFSMGDEEEIYLDSYDRAEMDAGLLRCDSICRGAIALVNMLAMGILTVDDMNNIYINPILPFRSKLACEDTLRAWITSLLSGDGERRTDTLYAFQCQYNKVSSDQLDGVWGVEHTLWEELIKVGQLVHKYRVYLSDDKVYFTLPDDTTLQIDIDAMAIALDYNQHTVHWLPGVLA